MLFQYTLAGKTIVTEFTFKNLIFTSVSLKVMIRGKNPTLDPTYDFHDFYLIESFFGWKIKNKKMLGTHPIYNGELKNKITE